MITPSQVHEPPRDRPIHRIFFMFISGLSPLSTLPTLSTSHVDAVTVGLPTCSHTVTTLPHLHCSVSRLRCRRSSVLVTTVTKCHHDRCYLAVLLLGLATGGNLPPPDQKTPILFLLATFVKRVRLIRAKACRLFLSPLTTVTYSHDTVATQLSLLSLLSLLSSLSYPVPPRLQPLVLSGQI